VSQFQRPVDLYTWFAQAELRPELGLVALVLGGLILAAVLGYVSFTDLFRGKRIPNRVSVPLIFGSMAAGPAIAQKPMTAIVFGVVASLFFFALGMTGGFGMGDSKLLCALAFLLGKAVIGVFFIAITIGLLYALPVMMKAGRDRRRGKFDGKIRKIKLQFGPAIAVAVALVVGVSSLSGWGAAFLLAELASFALFVATKGVKPSESELQQESWQRFADGDHERDLLAIVDRVRSEKG
jgi:Flp pilus assembly protein protease CpaA